MCRKKIEILRVSIFLVSGHGAQWRRSGYHDTQVARLVGTVYW